MNGNIIINACQELFDSLEIFDYDAISDIINKYNNDNIFEYNDFKKFVKDNQDKFLYIKFLNEDTPEILKNVSSEEMTELRQNAIFNFLFNSASRKILIKNKDMDFNFHLRLLTDYAWNKARLVYTYFEYKDFFSKREYRIRIENCENCYNCLIAYQIYNIDNIPELPYIDCTRKEDRHKCYYKLIRVDD